MIELLIELLTLGVLIALAAGFWRYTHTKPEPESAVEAESPHAAVEVIEA